MNIARRSLAVLVLVAATASLAGAASSPKAELSKVTPPAAATRRYDDAVLHVEITGKGAPMLFIPGLASSGAVYSDAVRRYAATHECHVVTLGGFAGQPRFEGPFLATARESLLAYLAKQKLARPVVVGHSLGGVLAMDLAIAAPEAIGPVIVLDALPFLGGAGQPDATVETVRAQMEPMRKMIASQTQEQYAAFQKSAPYLRPMVTSDADFAKLLDWTVTSDAKAVADGMYDVSTTDLREKIAGIRSRMLVLGSWYGMRAFTTREAVEGTFKTQFAKAPNWTFATADSACHFLMLDAPEWTWSKVDAFLAAREAPKSGGGR